MNIVVVPRDVSETKAGEFARQYGWLAATKSRQRSPGLVLSGRFDAAAIRSSLAAPFIGGVEFDPGRTQLLGQRFRTHLAAGGTGLNLRTDTAYHCEAARLFAGALRERLGADCPGDLELALHEVVANALIHGNLGVTSCGQGVEDFAEYCRSLDAMLAHPQRVQRRVEISAVVNSNGLEVAVQDEGAGYDSEAARQDAADSLRLHGLAIASAAARITVEDRGRCTIMTFSADRGVAE